jgi:hypothetical protein
VDVFRNGVRLAAADFTATTGTTVVLATACTAGDTVTTVSFYVSSVLNAIPATAGSVSDSYIVDVSASKLTGSRTIPKGTMPAGTVLQVVSTTLTSTQSTTSGTPTDITNFSATITPSSASNKVLVFVTTQFGGPANGYGYFLLLRGSTSIGLGTSATGSQVNVFLSSGYIDGVAAFRAASNSYLDSPATTSATTYKIQFASANPSNAFYINRQASTDNGAYINFPTSSITLMEIAA